MCVPQGVAETAPDQVPANAVQSVEVQRSPNNPLITFESSPTLGNNINGPSVIRVPDWIDDPLGKYYLYFGHHGGKFIRLAYADDLHGPWNIHEPGVLPLESAPAFEGHIASPDVLVDHDRQEIRMYFHGPAKELGSQYTGVAIAKDGLDFKASDQILGKFYFRVFRWQDAYFAIAKDWNSGWGELYRSESGLSPFESGGNIIRMIRHGAVIIRGDQLLVFYSRKGDAPERIVLATVDLSGDWRDWQGSEPIDVIAPETDYEGIAYPNVPSEYGGAIEVRQLRDPHVFEEDGRTYLFYSIAGEMGIAMAEIKIEMQGDSPVAEE